MQKDYLTQLEEHSIYILREAYYHFKDLAMLWSIGKDSTVLLWLAKKAFFSQVPFPLVHIDTSFKVPEMITYRDKIAKEWGLNLIVGQNKKAIADKATFPDGKDRLTCCKNLKSKALDDTLNGLDRSRLNLQTGELDKIDGSKPYTGVIVGIRADEEGSRSKERYFSARNKDNHWNIASQPPEIWNQYKTEFEPNTHVRIHPLLDWTELNIWEYINRENIPIIPLYFDKGEGKRYRSLGCYPCTNPVDSTAKNTKEIIEELKTGAFKNIAERSGRAQDKEGGGTLEELRKDGYM